jgi:hypothetical protein
MLKKTRHNYAISPWHKEIIERSKSINKQVLTTAKRVVWEAFSNKEVPATFAKKPQVIYNIDTFRDETYQLYSYLMEKHNAFKGLSLERGEEYEIIKFLTPGMDKPQDLIYWNKCLIATLCCGNAPTEEEYSSPSYHQIIDTIISVKLVPLVFILLIVVQKLGRYKICKGSRTIRLPNINKDIREHYIFISRYSEEEEARIDYANAKEKMTFAELLANRQELERIYNCNTSKQ